MTGRTEVDNTFLSGFQAWLKAREIRELSLGDEAVSRLQPREFLPYRVCY